jgi:hypothetical protein
MAHDEVTELVRIGAQLLVIQWSCFLVNVLEISFKTAKTSTKKRS